MLKIGMSFGLAIALIAGVARAEQVENPRYQAWARFAVGSSATVESNVDAGTIKMVSEMTQKLTENTEDHVTIEITTTMTVVGQQHTSPPRSQTISAKTEATEAQKKEMTPIASEEVEAAGKKFDCKVYEVEALSTNPQGASGKTKIWSSEEVPGGIVKMELKNSRGAMTSMLKEFQVKK